jgi:hypothetical protein
MITHVLTPRSFYYRAWALLVACWILLYLVANPAGAGQSAANAPGRISGPPEAQLVLSRMKAALGGENRLGGVRTLLIRGSNIYSGSPPSATPFTCRILLPDAFQEVLEKYSYAFTVIGENFWRRPALPPHLDSPGTRRNVIQHFSELCLIMLGRSPSQVAMSASIEKHSSGAVAKLKLTGDVTRTLEFDAQWRPHVLEHPVDMYSPGASIPLRTTRRLVVEKWAKISDIWFPVAMTVTYPPGAPSMATQFNEVRVNEGVSRGDFLAPSSDGKK